MYWIDSQNKIVFKGKEVSIYTCNSFLWDLWAIVLCRSCFSLWCHFSQLIKISWEREGVAGYTEVLCKSELMYKMSRFLHGVSKSVVWCWSDFISCFYHFKIEIVFCSYCKALHQKQSNLACLTQKYELSFVIKSNTIAYLKQNTGVKGAGHIW